MKRIDALLAGERPTFSFEFMSPRSDEEAAALFGTVTELSRLNPDFVCVTCRPNSRDATVDLTMRIQSQLDLVAMAHLVCVAASELEMRGLLDRLAAGGVRNVLALRGDIPAPGTAMPSASLEHASDLAAMIAGYGTFCIGGACYPERHPDSASLDDDLRYTLLKIRRGVSFLITQMFFDNAAYFRFVKQAAAFGVTVPVLPGIMPITHFRQIARIKAMGASIPPKLEALMMRHQNDRSAIADIGIAWAALQCVELLEGGAPGIHFYTFNRSSATRAIFGAIRAANLDASRSTRRSEATLAGLREVFLADSAR